MSDEELLEKYKKYIKKRNAIIVISLLFIIAIILVVLKINLQKENIIPPNNTIPVVEETKDDIPPILELNVNETKITIGEDFDYKKYIKNAFDEKDGDLMEKVEFSKIDLSKVGTYEIVYYVFDSSNNIAQQILTLIIEEKPKEIEPEPTKPDPSSQNNSQTTKPKVPNNNQNNNNKEKPSSESVTKLFLFTDGYTMSNVVEVCAKELKDSNRTGRCIPITDDNGIYLGMKLELN